MEQRLKKQRNRLILRVTLILSAVCVLFFITYCAIRLQNEKINLQNRSLVDLSYAGNVFSTSELGTPTASYVYIDTYNLMYFKNTIGTEYDLQLVVIDPDSQKILANTANKLEVKYSLQTDKGVYPDAYCYLDYPTVRGLMSDRQFERIAALLNSKRNDGKKYQLSCTEFYNLNDEIFPIKVSIILTGDKGGENNESLIVETFTLNVKKYNDAIVFRNVDGRENIIPKDFLLDSGYNPDYIGNLTDKQREKSSDIIPVGGLEYIFYTSDYYYLNAYVPMDNEGNYENVPKLYLVQYAKKADLLRNCLNDLLVSLILLFFFFFVIGFLLCLMIWRNVRVQITQEQKRRDLTNALAHDIKTPLFVISGYAYSLKENIDPDERNSYLDRIIGQTEQINSLVHKMLNLSKLDSYAVTLNRSEFDLYELVEEILKDFVSLPDGKFIETAHSGNSLIHADRALIRTALQNLIDNAVRYSLSGSGIIIEVTGQSVSVSNPCEQLTKTQLKQIWQPYYRMDKSRHRKGNGLGLSIVKSVLDLHGADYGVNYKDGSVIFDIKFKKT